MIEDVILQEVHLPHEDHQSPSYQHDHQQQQTIGEEEDLDQHLVILHHLQNGTHVHQSRILPQIHVLIINQKHVPHDLLHIPVPNQDPLRDLLIIIVLIIINIIDGNLILHELVIALLLTHDHLYHLHTIILFIFIHQTTPKRYESIQNSESVIIIHIHLHLSNQTLPSRNQFLITTMMNPPRKKKIVDI